MSPEKLALDVSTQVNEILKAKNVGGRARPKVHEILERNGTGDVMTKTMYAALIEGLRIVWDFPCCKHCVEDRYCRRQMGLYVIENGKSKSLCTPCGMGADILASAIVQKPACSGYEAADKETL